MTPTEIKAKIKAQELKDIFISTKLPNDSKRGWIMPKEVAVYFSTKCCEQVLETLNSMKGMAKIHKVKFWNLVNENIKNE